MPYADRSTQNANAALWYANNRDRHIRNVVARRSAGKRVRATRVMVDGWEDRQRIALDCCKRWHPALFYRFREECQQEAAIIAITETDFRAISNAMSRAAWKLRKEVM